MATKKTVRALILDIKKNEVRDEVIEKDFDNYYKIIGTDMVELPKYRVGGKVFEFVCDEEGLMKDNPIVSGFDEHGKALLVGTLIITGPNSRNLTDELVQHLRKFIVNTTAGWRLTGIEYC